MLLALVGCQSAPFNADEAIDYNDKTLVMGGCESGLGRGFVVCRFVEGSPIESSLSFFVPTDPGYSHTDLRIRHGDNLLLISNETSGMISVPFTTIVVGKKWTMEHDGPIQILATVTDKDGPKDKIKLLGYAYIVVLKAGYSPRLLNWPAPNYGPITCAIRYTPAGQSEIKCHE